MATTKTLTPTNQTITIAAFQGEKPDQKQVADAESKLADALNALNPKKNSVSSISSDTEILTWSPGAYMIALNANSEYIPTRYGTLVIEHGSGNYGVATFTSTTGNLYFRHMNGTTGWHTDWTQVALNSQIVYGFNEMHKRVAWGTSLNVEHSTANPLWLVGINAQELYLVANQTGGLTYNKVFGATTTATIARESTTKFTVTRDSNASIYAIAL